MENIIKFSEKKMQKNRVSGNFLYYFKEKYHFTDRNSHSIFLNNKPNESGSSYENGDLFLNLEAHFLNYLKACSLSANTPAILTVNAYTKFEQLESALGQKYSFADSTEDFIKNQTNACFKNVLSPEFEPLITPILKERTDVFPVPNELLVFIFNAEDEKIEHLTEIITIARSRNVYITLEIQNIEKFVEIYGKETFDIILQNCRIIFGCNNNEIIDITLNHEKTIKFKK